jgi:hypothetical protein
MGVQEKGSDIKKGGGGGIQGSPSSKRLLKMELIIRKYFL